MPSLHLFTSNKLEVLVERLASRLREEPLPALQQETVVVQSKGMQHWLNLEIAKRNKISANIHFPFPKTFIYQLFQGNSTQPEEKTFSVEVMTWQIMKVFSEQLERDDYTDLKRYEGDTYNPLKRLQLAEKIAEMFDHYLVYRPDLILEWDKGNNPLSEEYKESHWQFSLWRDITRETREADQLLHPAALFKSFVSDQTTMEKMADRISVFGISSLPPFYLDTFVKLSERVRVDFYYLNPCREYWEYCYSDQEIARFNTTGFSEDDQYYESGNSLLASMGVTGREFFSQVLNVVGETGEAEFQETTPTTLLDHIQSDILNLIERKDDLKLKIDGKDKSIQIHSCYSPIREIEVLHDNLLALFEDGELSSSDVVVMMPDVSGYDQLIRAVFDAPEAGEMAIPYAITDTAIDGSNPLVEPFLAILKIDQSRFRASEVLDILESRAIRNKFDFEEADIASIRFWVKESGIRWGVNEGYKKGLDLPEVTENSWEFGIRRLLLGIALPQKEHDSLFQGILPCANTEGDQAYILGRFIKFVDLLIKWATILKKPRNLKSWIDCLSRVLSDFFEVDDATETYWYEIKDSLLENGYLGLAAEAGFDEAISLDVILFYITKKISSHHRSSGFLTKGVTFCTLLPMRSIPFKVIYVLGMNDGDFPRKYQSPGFNLMEREKRLGDRSKRQEDKYLFLECILSAREALIISYVGRSNRDGSDLPPSGLVTELCDTLENGFEQENGQSILESVIQKHPLQPFSRSYFDDSRGLFSYSAQNCEAAVENESPYKKERCFFPKELPTLSNIESPEVTMEQFCRFFRNPSETLLRNRLHIMLSLDDQFDIDDREPFELNSLEKYLIKGRFIDDWMGNIDFNKHFEHLKANGSLPHGSPGLIAFDSLQKEILTFTLPLIPLMEKGPNPTRQIHLEFSKPEFKISGVLKNIFDEEQVFFRPAKLKAGDVLSSWIHHLIYCCVNEGEDNRQTRYIGTDKTIELSPVNKDEAHEILAGLATLYLKGLRCPLPFFPESSFAFAQKIAKGKSEEEGLKAATQMWHSSFLSQGEKENAYYQICFGDKVPFSRDFVELATLVFEPLFQYMTETKRDDIV
ncbi:exodeoxyribonuclease V subunit gamma [bacterium]|nr:exodeoxyribonuclease V subunit gamma [bacterium]